MNTSPLELIQLNLYQFTKKERQIAEYILEDPHRVIQNSAEMIATDTHSSKAAFIRFCQKIGFNGYVEFRFALSRSLVANVSYTQPEDSIQRITSTYAQYITQISTMVNQSDLAHLSKSILRARRIKIYGVNRTYLSALQLRMRLIKIGLDAEAIDDQANRRDVSSYLGPDDLVLIFSIKANPYMYEESISTLVSNQVPFVLFTMTPNNTYRDLATQMFTLPYISKSSSTSFLDDQATFFVFIELLLNEVARVL